MLGFKCMILSSSQAVVGAALFWSSRNLYSMYMPDTWNFAWDYAIFIQVRHRTGMNISHAGL
jgi:hypothetical protein